MKSNINVPLIIHFYVFKLVIMLQIILCHNKDVTPIMYVRKSGPWLTPFEKNYICLLLVLRIL
jgi:hypothetical protein